MVGKNVAPGVVGGIVKDSTGAYVASDIDSASGTPVSGGDIPVAASLVSVAKTLGAALGIPATASASDFVAGAGGKVVQAAVTA